MHCAHSEYVTQYMCLHARACVCARACSLKGCTTYLACTEARRSRLRYSRAGHRSTKGGRNDIPTQDTGAQGGRNVAYVYQGTHRAPVQSTICLNVHQTSKQHTWTIKWLVIQQVWLSKTHKPHTLGKKMHTLGKIMQRLTDHR